MKNLAKVLLTVIGIFDVIHLGFLTFMPFVGLKVFFQGIFYGAIYNSWELADIAPQYKLFLNISSSLLYVGSLIIALLIITCGKQNVNKKLLWAFMFTLIPWLLIMLKVYFVPF